MSTYYKAKTVTFQVFAHRYLPLFNNDDVSSLPPSVIVRFPRPVIVRGYQARMGVVELFHSPVIQGLIATIAIINAALFLFIVAKTKVSHFYPTGSELLCLYAKLFTR